ncbi:hypothetical protein Pmani_022672 [Petrolisthes manimaculis]|uniref:Uncharacterized protein n=1 Tax=Petrolisthes manimaculis TaxID=1843537 RepID=A0AAE1U430_9EUCA|nr:hypothetical protein Pmani_022672 [Petrolisthes manimaculis]
MKRSCLDERLCIRSVRDVGFYGFWLQGSNLLYIDGTKLSQSLCGRQRKPRLTTISLTFTLLFPSTLLRPSTLFRLSTLLRCSTLLHPSRLPRSLHTSPSLYTPSFPHVHSLDPPYDHHAAIRSSQWLVMHSKRTIKGSCRGRQECFWPDLACPVSGEHQPSGYRLTEATRQPAFRNMSESE